MKIAIGLPPFDRPSSLLDADEMVAGIFSDGEQRVLNLDLNTGKLEFQSPGDVGVVERDPLGRWRLMTIRRNGNTEGREWELIVTNPDGSETKKQFEFPTRPIVLDVNTVIASSDKGLNVLDLRTNTLKSQSFGAQLKLNDMVARALPSRHYLEVLSATSGTSTDVFTVPHADETSAFQRPN